MKKTVKLSQIVYVIILIGLALTVFLTMEYTDGLANANAGFMLCYGLFHGSFMEVYNSTSFPYGFTLYFIYMIWSLPLAIRDAITGGCSQIYTSIYISLWYKLLLILFAVISCVYFYKIIKLTTHNSKEIERYSCVLYLTSPALFMLVLAVTQCDVIALAMDLMGLYYLMTKKKTRAAVFFGLAISMKYMSVFMIVPVMLLGTKNLRRLVLPVSVVGVFVLGSLGLSSLSTAVLSHYAEGDSYVSDHIIGLIGTGSFGVGNGGISLLVFLFVGLCIYAYYKDLESDSEYNEWVMWFATAGWLVLSGFYDMNVYWNVFVAPFIIFSTLKLNYEKKIFEIGTWMEIISVSAMLLACGYSSPWVLGGDERFAHLLLRNNYSMCMSVHKFLCAISRGIYENMRPSWLAVKILGFIIILVMSNPDVKRNYLRKKTNKPIECDESDLKRYAWEHLLVIALWVRLMFVGM